MQCTSESGLLTTARAQYFKLVTVLQMEAFTFRTQTFVLVCLLELKSEFLRGKQPAVAFCLVSAETFRIVVLLIAWLSLSLFLFNYLRTCKKLSSVFHKKLVPPLFLPVFEAFSNKVYYAIQINLVDFVKSLLCVLAEIPLTDRPKQNKQSRCQPSPQREETAVMMKPSMVNIAQNSNFIMF